VGDAMRQGAWLVAEERLIHSPPFGWEQQDVTAVLPFNLSILE
jgi:hypothetical protein